MKTRITELFGIRRPIVLSGMSWISVPQMVAAVSNAGGMGILATGPLDVDQTRQAIQEIRARTDRPFGANATLLMSGAAAHGDAVTSMVLIPSLVDALEIPVIAAGGFADGRGLAAALALGADGIAMGTRFMTTKESPLHATFKKLSLEKGVYDTLYSTRFDGIYCRVMKTDAAERALRQQLDLIEAFRNARDIARQLRLPFFKLFLGVLASGWKNAWELARMANGFKAFRIATEDGDNKKGLLPVGQVTGLIHDEPTVSDLIERIVAEARQILNK